MEGKVRENKVRGWENKERGIEEVNGDEGREIKVNEGGVIVFTLASYMLVSDVNIFVCVFAS